MSRTKRIKSKFFLNIIKTKNLLSLKSYTYLFKSPILLYYSDFSKNWGDFVNPFLLKQLSDKKVISVKRIFNISDKEVLYGIGSILKNDLKNSIIWGSGFIKPPLNKKIIAPNKILALRGKLTAAVFEKQGIVHDHIYGDPALLFPEIYKPKKNIKFKLGIIPHYTEVDKFLSSEFLIKNKDICIISPMVKDNNFLDIIDKIHQCENIMSSSLHGLILADSYQLPSLRFKFKKNNIIGGDFKFDDYYSGVGINTHYTHTFENVNHLDIDEILEKAELKKLNFDSNKLKMSLLNYLNEPK